MSDCYNNRKRAVRTTVPTTPIFLFSGKTLRNFHSRLRKSTLYLAFSCDTYF